MTSQLALDDPRWTVVPATLTIFVPHPTDLTALGRRIVDAVGAASATEDELGPARPLVLDLWQLELPPVVVARVMARAERAHRLEVMDGREIVYYAMALLALRLDEPEGWAGLDTLARVKRTVNTVLGKPDDPLLQAVVMPISARELSGHLPGKTAHFAGSPPTYTEPH